MKKAKELSNRLARVAENNGMNGLQLEAFEITLEQTLSEFATEIAREQWSLDIRKVRKFGLFASNGNLLSNHQNLSAFCFCHNILEGLY